MDSAYSISFNLPNSTTSCSRCWSYPTITDEETDSREVMELAQGHSVYD